MALAAICDRLQGEGHEAGGKKSAGLAGLSLEESCRFCYRTQLMLGRPDEAGDHSLNP